MGDRRMVYAYTFTAKLAEFPYKFYYNNSPFFKFSVWGILVVLPFFWKMQQLSCSEANYIKLANYRKKEWEEIQHHKEHLK